VNFHVSTLNESHHLLVKISCESVFVKIVAIKCMICSMLFSTNIAVAQEVIVAVIAIALFYLHASDVHQHMFN